MYTHLLPRQIMHIRAVTVLDAQHQFSRELAGRQIVVLILHKSSSVHELERLVPGAALYLHILIHTYIYQQFNSYLGD
jgi:hypothetical protein